MGFFVPSNRLIKQAIALELNQTEQQLIEQLGINSQGFEINHLRVKKREPLLLKKLKTYHLAGKYDLKFKLPSHEINQNQKSFDIYLQSQSEAKTWRLLIPENEKNQDSPIWRSYLIE